MKTKIDKETYEHFVEEYKNVVKAVFVAEDKLKEQLKPLIEQNKSEEYLELISRELISSTYEIKE